MGKTPTTTSTNSSTSIPLTGTTSTSTTTNITPLTQIKQVLGGQAFNIQQILGLTPLYDLQSSLNAKYGVFPTTKPNSPGALNYFGIGIGGRRIVSSQNLTQPQEILSTNMDLYSPIPIRVVPFDQDLSPSEQSNYRLRQVQTINGQKYVCYWLMVITKDNMQVQYFKLDSQGNQQPYTPDYSNLNPVPPSPTTDGTVDSVGAEINVVAQVTMNVTGVEVSEAISVMYNGDARYATISEVGLYTGTDQTMSYTNSQGQTQSYTEGLCVQLHTQMTFNGWDLSSPNSTFTENFYLGSGRRIAVG